MFTYFSHATWFVSVALGLIAGCHSFDQKTKDSVNRQTPSGPEDSPEKNTSEPANSALTYTKPHADPRVCGGEDIDLNKDGTFTELEMPPNRMVVNHLAWINKKLYVWATFGDSNHAAVLNTEDKTWSDMSWDGFPKSISDTQGHEVSWGTPTIACAAGRLILWGGTGQRSVGGDASTTVYVNEGHMYDPQTAKWTKMASENAPAPGMKQVAVSTGDKLILLSSEGDGAIFSPLNNSWTKTSVARLPRDGMSSGFWLGKEMMIWWHHRNASTASLYDPSNDRVRSVELPDNIPCSKANVECEQFPLILGDKFVVYGSDGSIASFDTATGGWTTKETGMKVSFPSTIYSRNDHIILTGGQTAILFYESKLVASNPDRVEVGKFLDFKNFAVFDLPTMPYSRYALPFGLIQANGFLYNFSYAFPGVGSTSQAVESKFLMFY